TVRITVVAISTNDNDAPIGQLFCTRIWSATAGAIMRKLGPPRSTGVAYAFMASMVHRMAAAAMPGIERGRVTSRHVWKGVPPRLSDASSTDGFSPSSTLCSVRMTNDRLMDTMPMNTAGVVYIISSGAFV